MVHGWMDVAASFQFVIDAFETDRQVIAPDWRGYGLTQWGASDNYWYPDYLADLDAIAGAQPAWPRLLLSFAVAKHHAGGGHRSGPSRRAGSR